MEISALEFIKIAEGEQPEKSEVATGFKRRIGSAAGTAALGAGALGTGYLAHKGLQGYGKLKARSEKKKLGKLKDLKDALSRV